MNVVKYGIIGTGGAWDFHKTATVNSPKIKLVSVYDINEKRARRTAKNYNMEPYSSELNAFFKSDIDAVIVMVPHYLHEQYVIAAAEAGKHVLCEKPMATSLEACDQMINACEKAGVKFMIAENHRFLPAHKYCWEVVQKGLLGKIFLIRAYEGVNEISGLMKKGFWKGDPLKAGGGALMDMGVHRFATMNWILNDSITSVYSWITKQCTSLEEKAEDNAMVLLQFKKGTIGETVVSFTVKTPPTNRLEIYGTNGTILEDHSWEKPVKINSYHENMKDRRGIWIEPEIEHGIYPKYYQISARIEDEHFTDCILLDKDPEFTPNEAKNAVATVLMAYLSARLERKITHKELVELQETKGTKSILIGLEKTVINNFERF